MDDLREQLADVIEVAIDNVHDIDVTHRDYASAAADAIIAALPGMVQPLVWGVDWRGRSFNASYTIWEFPLGFSVEHGQDGETITNPLKTLEDAKDAAQSHHTTTILEALGIEND